jgi:DNA-binding MarR family transcriptional regulator
MLGAALFKGHLMSNPREFHPDQLVQLSNEVSRIAGTLARLSTQPQALADHTTSDVIPEVSAEEVRAVIRARRLRTRYFSDELFADPAWDMMLELFRAELAQQRISISSLCMASAVPQTTALRWINTMVRSGLLCRHSDPVDGRRIFIELAPDTKEALRRYFADIAVAGV